MDWAHTAASTALVLETNNLRGGDGGLSAAGTSLARLLGRLRRQTLPLDALAQLVITHDGLDATTRTQLEAAAGRRIDFVELRADTGYYDAKNVGFAATDAQRCRYVVFGDADCLPADDWLAELLRPFTEEAPPAAVAGRTSYPEGLVGTALTTIDFMYFPSPLAAGATRNFYANNIAFRREVFAAHAYQALPGVYRAHCQVLGLRLQAAGVAVRFAPEAHTVHRLPDSWTEALQLRWMRGQDTQGLVPHLVRAYAPRWAQGLARSGPVAPVLVQLVRFGSSLRALNHQHLPRVRGGRWLAALALITGFSLIDLLGALARGLGLRTVSDRADAQALSYHRAA